MESFGLDFAGVIFVGFILALLIGGELARRP